MTQIAENALKTRRNAWFLKKAQNAQKTQESRKEYAIEQSDAANRLQSLELRPRPARRWAVVHGLHGADHVPALPEDGRRADAAAVQPASDCAKEVRLGEPGQVRRR